MICFPFGLGRMLLLHPKGQSHHLSIQTVLKLTSSFSPLAIIERLGLGPFLGQLVDLPQDARFILLLLPTQHLAFLYAHKAWLHLLLQPSAYRLEGWPIVFSFQLW